jgi:hypothetical protein
VTNRPRYLEVPFGSATGWKSGTRSVSPPWWCRTATPYEELDNDFWKPLKAYWKDRIEKNAELLRKFLTLEATKWQYTHGVRNAEAVSPDAWTIDQAVLDRPGHFALEEDGDRIADLIQQFLRKHAAKK